MKYHIHSEQFDGALHAACSRFPHDPFPNEQYAKYILNLEEFVKMPKEKRCSYCELDQFPFGIPWWYGRDHLYREIHHE